MDLLGPVLRLHPEPFDYVDEMTVHDALTVDPVGYLAFLDELLAAVAGGQASVELPDKQLFPDPDGGDFRVMPCVLRAGGRVHKTVKVVGTNTVGRHVPDQVTVGKALRLDPEENYVTHIFEACVLSSARTGACAALAVAALAARPARVVVVGAGRVGFYSALFLAASAPVEEIVLHDLHLRRAERCAAALHDIVGASVRVGDGDDARADARDADVVMLATTSTAPFHGPGGEASVVVSTGADTSWQHELASSWATEADIYTDTLDSLLVGDLADWVGAGLLGAGDVSTLVEVYRRLPLPPPRRPRLFVSTGSALFDNLTIAYVVGRR